MAESLLTDKSLFLQAEQIAQEFNLFPSADPDADFHVEGLVSETAIHQQLKHLAELDIDSYIEAAVSPAEMPGRENAVSVVLQLGKVRERSSDGPYFEALIDMVFPQGVRTIAVIAQDRRHRNGEWMPEHHLAAAQFAKRCAKQRLPIVSFMDTLGAAGDEIANRNNQAHQISRLIAVMSDVDVPNLGIIFGIGYSGGAIPLAASNMILSVRDGVFSTIQPRSLASIARRLNLSWQECAKHIGISAFELVDQGNIDGIIDYTPNEPQHLANLRSAIVTGITSVEASVAHFVKENDAFLYSYGATLRRFLNPPSQLVDMETMGDFVAHDNTTEFSNIFGEGYRYLRYLRVRRRIKATSSHIFGRLAEQQMLPEGELAKRIDRDRRKTFLRWIQDPDHVLYDDTLKNVWRNFTNRRDTREAETSRIQQFLRVDREQLYRDARADVLTQVTMYLYNHWKTSSAANLDLLGDFLSHPEDLRLLFTRDQIAYPDELIEHMQHNEVASSVLRDHFSFDGRKLLFGGGDTLGKSSFDQKREQLVTELNLSLTGGTLADGEAEKTTNSSVRANRKWLTGHFEGQISDSVHDESEKELGHTTVLDILKDSELRQDFLTEIENIRILDAMYDGILENLNIIAEEASRKQSLSKRTTQDLYSQYFDDALVQVVGKTRAETHNTALRSRFEDWFLQLNSMRGVRNFYIVVEEWKKSMFTHLSDTLFVVVRIFFSSILVSYFKSEREDTKFNGKIVPFAIGRKKDFWHRLSVAYRDLLLQEVLNDFKAQRRTTAQAFIDTFFNDFEEMYGDRISSDPCDFPGFRSSIETALDREQSPCGVIAGRGKFVTEKGEWQVGTLISNAGFQAGAFDMASAEKFCRLLVRCAEDRVPLVCFISSGGMQTKEGAGALFSMAAVNDRITQFVREFGLPVIIFGYGDCTGGAQASFVTHPLVQTYYFSGTSMPFAGQLVIQSNLPLESIISNYLATVPGSMQGLVQHPLLPGLDEALQKVDAEIPVASQTVGEVVQNVLSGQINLEERVVEEEGRVDVRESDLFNPVKRVLVHARGCAASKVVKIAQKNKIQVVLVQSDPDEDSVASNLLLKRDRLVSIGGSTPDESYLNARSVLAVAENEKVDALHPGIGFLSESSQFAGLVRSRGINFIGPPVSSMETMGNKSNAITTAMRMNVPVVPGSHGVVTEVETAIEIAEKAGYPVLIKAVHGGGGKGIQIVNDSPELPDLFQRVSVEARAAFGSGEVYIEKYVTSLRHIEVQVLRDRFGNTKVLGIRDCSVQRNKQKIFEESASTMLPDNLLQDVLKHSQAIADAVDYVGAGTVEFIYDLNSDAVYFMEMNTRLQVEHPVTELVSGIDIVSEQFRIASGESIGDLAIDSDGYAIEARVNAEGIVKNAEGGLAFQPSAGLITCCEYPKRKDVEVISTAASDKEISPYYDSMIMQIIAHGSDRDDTIQKLDNYLSKVKIQGIKTNIPFLRRVLADEVFVQGKYDTAYLEGFFERVDADALIEEIRAESGDLEGGLGLATIQIEDSDELKVVSPSTGIFYLKPAPAEPDYTHVGAVVTTDDVICQLEAFKVFAPLRLRDFNSQENALYDAESKFTIKRVNVETGEQVNTGDLLFIIEPS